MICVLEPSKVFYGYDMNFFNNENYVEENDVVVSCKVSENMLEILVYVILRAKITETASEKQKIGFLLRTFPVAVYLLKVNYRNTRTKCEICSKFTTKTPDRRHRCRPGVFIVIRVIR